MIMFNNNVEYNAPDCCEYVISVDEMLCTSFSTPEVEEVAGDFEWI